ncbi:hypothetical protein AAIR98_001871 [Elusimicrobium simillimum]|uniref:hypothetical protein n=1 Tax=Elusimicrobium simillimum TaxID=3143438 RepID=UPI003C6ECF84
MKKSLLYFMFLAGPLVLCSQQNNPTANTKDTAFKTDSEIITEYKEEVKQHAQTDKYFGKTFISSQKHMADVFLFITDPKNYNFFTPVTSSKDYRAFISSTTDILLLGEYHDPDSKIYAKEILNEIKKIKPNSITAVEYPPSITKLGKEFSHHFDFDNNTLFLEDDRVLTLLGVFPNNRLEEADFNYEENLAFLETEEAMAHRNHTSIQRLRPYLKNTFITFYGGLGHIRTNGESGALSVRLKEENVQISTVFLLNRARLYKETKEDTPLGETFIITVPLEYKEIIGTDYILLF